MEIKTIHLVYYSATFTTRRIMRAMADSFDGVEVKEYDITDGTVGDDVTLSSDGDLLIVGVPSYAGRVPQMAVSPIGRLNARLVLPAPDNVRLEPYPRQNHTRRILRNVFRADAALWYVSKEQDILAE